MPSIGCAGLRLSGAQAPQRWLLPWERRSNSGAGLQGAISQQRSPGFSGEHLGLSHAPSALVCQAPTRSHLPPFLQWPRSGWVRRAQHWRPIWGSHSMAPGPLGELCFGETAQTLPVHSWLFCGFDCLVISSVPQFSRRMHLKGYSTVVWRRHGPSEGLLTVYKNVYCPAGQAQWLSVGP